jgi:hypothetical protein
MRASANSVSLENILFDHEVVKRLNSANVELIANSFGQYWLEEDYAVIREAALAQLLVIENIPNYLTSEGPYHPSIDDARENPYLVDFRKWISSTASSTDPNELQDVKRDVEEAIRKAQDELFLEYLNPRTRYYSVAKTLGSAALDVLIPGMSTAVLLAQDISDIRKKDAMRWQGFLVSLKERQ